jgi:hypothetical protein
MNSSDSLQSSYAAATAKWDVGPGETASFPTKWMSADGKTAHLVFSGDDHFAVCEASLTVAPPDKCP